MLEIILNEKGQCPAVKEVRWMGKALPNVESVEISFYTGYYPEIQITMRAVPVKIDGGEILARVKLLSE